VMCNYVAVLRRVPHRRMLWYCDFIIQMSKSVCATTQVSIIELGMLKTVGIGAGLLHGPDGLGLAPA
jgi:hypothetical protein